MIWTWVLNVIELDDGKIFTGNQSYFPMKIMGLSGFNFPLNQSIDNDSWDDITHITRDVWYVCDNVDM